MLHKFLLPFLTSTFWIPPIPDEIPNEIILDGICPHENGINLYDAWGKGVLVIGFFWIDCPVSTHIGQTILNIRKNHINKLSSVKVIGINSLLKKNAEEKICDIELDSVLQDRIVPETGDDSWIMFGAKKDDVEIFVDGYLKKSYPFEKMQEMDEIIKIDIQHTLFAAVNESVQPLPITTIQNKYEQERIFYE